MAAQEVVLVMGYPASGKSELALGLEERGFLRLSRDVEGGAVIELLPKLRAALAEGRSVVVDNLFGTSSSRRPFIEAARGGGAEVRCLWMQTSIEDSILNALFRMVRRHGKAFMTQADLAEVKGDPNMFPIAVPFAYRKSFEKPSREEGFSAIEKITFHRRSLGYQNKALLLDYDGTLRTVRGGGGKFPTSPDDVELLSGRREVLRRYQDEGYILLGVSNQSGIARGELSREMAEACFRRTNELLGLEIDVSFCPHGVPPSCYCRKPQSGLGVVLIERYQLDPAQCIVVGDQKTDSTFATRLGMTFRDQSEFFGSR